MRRIQADYNYKIPRVGQSFIMQLPKPNVTLWNSYYSTEVVRINVLNFKKNNVEKISTHVTNVVTATF